MGSGAVRRDVEALPLEERVSLHAPVLVRRAHHGVPELHGIGAQRRRSGPGGWGLVSAFLFFLTKPHLLRSNYVNLPQQLQISIPPLAISENKMRDGFHNNYNSRGPILHP